MAPTPVRATRRAWRLLPALVVVLAAACNDRNEVLAPTPASLTPRAAAGGMPAVTVVGLEPLVDASRNFSEAVDVNDLSQVVGVSAGASGLERAVIWDNTPYPIDLGVLDETSRAYAIGADGSTIVGTSMSNQQTVAVRWIRPAESWVIDMLPRYPSATSCTARDVTVDGTIVGDCLVAGVSHAMIWQNGVVRALGLGSARSVNAAGQIVGVSATEPVQALLWTPAGSATALGTLGGNRSAAFGVDASGHVVGASDDASGASRYRAFLWTPKKGMVDLGSLTTSSVAVATNGTQIVGFSEAAPNAAQHATLWQRGKIVDLGVLPGYERSTASSLNGRGQVVGTSGAFDISRATMWTVKWATGPAAAIEPPPPGSSPHCSRIEQPAPPGLRTPGGGAAPSHLATQTDRDRVRVRPLDAGRVQAADAHDRLQHAAPAALLQRVNADPGG